MICGKSKALPMVSVYVWGNACVHVRVHLCVCVSVCVCVGGYGRGSCFQGHLYFWVFLYTKSVSLLNSLSSVHIYAPRHRTQTHYVTSTSHGVDYMKVCSYRDGLCYGNAGSKGMLAFPILKSS